jgi:hypothetical protein
MRVKRLHKITNEKAIQLLALNFAIDLVRRGKTDPAKISELLDSTGICLDDHLVSELNVSDLSEITALEKKTAA